VKDPDTGKRVARINPAEAWITTDVPQLRIVDDALWVLTTSRRRAALVTRKLTNGHPDFIQVVSKSDGKDYPQYQSVVLANFQIDGTKTPVTYSETVIDDHAVNVIAKLNGQINNKGVRRIDADGKTMTIDVVAIDQSGKETPIKLVFNRVAGK
jgi:hypothetical protein